MSHAETTFRLSAKWTSTFKSAGGRQFSLLLASEVCASAVVMLDTPCSEVVWRVLATHCIRQFPLHFPSRASPCAITFQLESNTVYQNQLLCSILCILVGTLIFKPTRFRIHLSYEGYRVILLIPSSLVWNHRSVELIRKYSKIELPEDVINGHRNASE